eukprot:scaffold59505_cov17-Tisochrysis_lutea.AAC.2
MLETAALERSSQRTACISTASPFIRVRLYLLWRGLVVRAGAHEGAGKDEPADRGAPLLEGRQGSLRQTMVMACCMKVCFVHLSVLQGPTQWNPEVSDVGAAPCWSHPVAVLWDQCTISFENIFKPAWTSAQPATPDIPQPLFSGLSSSSTHAASVPKTRMSCQKQCAYARVHSLTQ